MAGFVGVGGSGDGFGNIMSLVEDAIVSLGVGELAFERLGLGDVAGALGGSDGGGEIKFSFLLLDGAVVDARSGGILGKFRVGFDPLGFFGRIGLFLEASAFAP